MSVVKDRGRVVTVRGAVPASALGRVLMHEHLHRGRHDHEEEPGSGSSGAVRAACAICSSWG